MTSSISRLVGLPALGALALGLAACADPQAEQALFAQRAFVGMPAQTLLSCAGVPERRASVDDVDYFTYSSERVTTTAVPAPGFGPRYWHPWYGWVDSWGWDQYYGDVETRSCEATFVLKGGVVTQIVYGGSTDSASGRLGQCYTIVQNCLPLVPPPPQGLRGG